MLAARTHFKVAPPTPKNRWTQTPKNKLTLQKEHHTNVAHVTNCTLSYLIESTSKDKPSRALLQNAKLQKDWKMRCKTSQGLQIKRKQKNPNRCIQQRSVQLTYPTTKAILMLNPAFPRHCASHRCWILLSFHLSLSSSLHKNLRCTNATYMQMTGLAPRFSTAWPELQTSPNRQAEL